MLSYAWRVVSAPSCAKPQLRDRTSATPEIKTENRPALDQVALRANAGNARHARRWCEQRVGGCVIMLDSVLLIGAQGRCIQMGLFGQTSKLEGPFKTLYVEGQGVFTDRPVAPWSSRVELDETNAAAGTASGNRGRRSCW